MSTQVLTSERARRAQEARVRRGLARQGQRLWIPRGQRAWTEFGPYAVVDSSSSALVAWGCDLDTLERQLREERFFEHLEAAWNN